VSFKRRQIDVTFKLGEGQFGESGFDTVKLSGLRCQVDIALAGGISKGALNLRAYGMTMDMMNKLAKIGRQINDVRNNVVSIEASNDTGGMSKVFEGSIFIAWADFNGAPDVCMNIEAAAGWFEANKPIEASSIKGGMKVATFIQGLAQSMGMDFQGNGVQAMLPTSYFPGTAWDQLLAAVQMAGINYSFDKTNNVIAIWEKGKYRSGSIPVISPETGLIGYPKFNDQGITLTTEFNPDIVSGGLIEVKTSLEPAAGFWIVNLISTNLSSEMPGGPWFTTMECSRYDQPVIKSI
jgi:hypothetical protein